jgi:hypothetical protein
MKHVNDFGGWLAERESTQIREGALSLAYDAGRLNEGKQVGLLYHYTSAPALLNILKQNSLRISSSGRPYVSFTRDKNFHKTARWGLSGNLDCVIVVDGDKLSANYKIEPYQYHFKDYDSVSPASRDESEETVKKSILNLKKYIVDVKCFLSQDDFEHKVNFERGFEQSLYRHLSDTEYTTFINYINNP